MRCPAYLIVACFTALLADPAMAQRGWGPRSPAAPDTAGPPAVLPSPARGPGSPSETGRREVLAPLPAPQVGSDAAPAAFVRDAEAALAAGRQGEAQEAIERAEARLLDRDVDPRRIGDASGDPVIALLRQARAALGQGDRVAAMEALGQARERLEER